VNKKIDIHALGVSKRFTGKASHAGCFFRQLNYNANYADKGSYNLCFLNAIKKKNCRIEK